MAEFATRYQLSVEIDIVATTFTAAWLPPGGSPTPPVTHPQRPEGYTALQRQLATTGIAPAALVVLEATGSYWVALAVTLHTAGYRVSVINPLQAHHFTKAQLRRAKTDPLDAQNLAQLAAALQAAVWTPPPTVYHEVRQRLTARDALVAMRQQTRNQRHALVQWPVVVASVQDHLDAVITMLDARIADLEAATTYAGLAPMPQTSGTSVRGYARIGHGGQSLTHCAIHGHAGGGTVQSRDQGVLYPLTRGG